MIDTGSIVNNINYFLVFTEGVISFFSPCILPLIPLYIGYLTQNCRKTNADGEIVYEQGKVLLYTLFFILGITTTFFIAGAATSMLSEFLVAYQNIISIIGGTIIFVIGLIQFGVFEKLTFTKEWHLPVSMKKMNFLMAYVMGFGFSFAWTPCVGPMLASVMILASSSSAAVGNLLICLYALGFCIPFLLMGLFTSTILSLIKKYQGVVAYTIKLGGICLIIIGLFMCYNGYSKISSVSNLDSSLDFTLQDQNNVTYTLSEQKGKTVVLAFFASWCPFCNEYISEIQALYDMKLDDVVILGVMAPNSGKEVSKNELLTYLKTNNVTYPVLFDLDSRVFNTYGVSSLPTTFVLMENGEFLGYQSGLLTSDILKQIVDSAKAEIENKE